MTFDSRGLFYQLKDHVSTSRAGESLEATKVLRKIRVMACSSNVSLRITRHTVLVAVRLCCAASVAQALSLRKAKKNVKVTILGFARPTD